MPTSLASSSPQPPQVSHSCASTAYTLNVPMYSDLVTSQGIVGADAILKLIDVAGCIPSKRHLGDHLDPVTACIDGMTFFAPVYPWNILSLDARITQVWGTSMETRVVVTAWDFRQNTTTLIAVAYVVTVATAERGAKKADKSHIPALQIITPEGRLLANLADKRKELRTRERESQPQWYRITPEEQLIEQQRELTHEDGNGLQQNVFGGVTLSMLQQTAREAAMLWCGHEDVVAVRQDRTDFKTPAKIGDTMVVRACVTATWKSSFELQVECYSVEPSTQTERLVAQTYCVFVQVEAESGRPSPLTKQQQWTPKTPEQQQRHTLAQLRRTHRQQEDAWFEA